METHYYEAYNRPNIRLVDLLETPIDKIKDDGLQTSKEEFKLDTIVYATGFSASKNSAPVQLRFALTQFTVTGAFDAIDFRGVDGVKLLDQWQHGPKTYLGLTVQGFPNMFMSIGPHQAYGNIPRSIEYAVGWISECIEFLRDHNIRYIEAKEKGVGYSYSCHILSSTDPYRYSNGPLTSTSLERAC